MEFDFIFFFSKRLVLDEKTPVVVSRTLLQSYAKPLKSLPPELHKQVAQFALEKIQPRVVAFEEQISAIRIDLAKLYEEEEEWREAAKVLIGIPLDGSGRYQNLIYKTIRFFV